MKRNLKELEDRAIEILIADYKEVDTEEYTRESIDDCEGPVKICGINFTASQILEEMDPIAFRCSISDYESMMESGNEWFSPDGGNTYYEQSDYEAALGQAMDESEPEEEV